MAPAIDAHAHVFGPADADPRAVNGLVPRERAAPLSQYRQRLDDAGVDHAVLVALDPADDYVAASLAADPRRFRAVAVAAPEDLGLTAEDPVDHLRSRRETFPFSAVRTTWLAEPGAQLADSPVNPLLAYMEQEGLILWSYLGPDQAPFLDEVGTRFPQLRVVLNHFGFTPADMQVDRAERPWFATGLSEPRQRAVSALARYPMFHLMFSGQYALSHHGYPYPDLHAGAAELTEAFGPERTLWGSDWPWVDAEPGFAAALELVDAMLGHLTRDERADVLGGTADRLFGFT